MKYKRLLWLAVLTTVLLGPKVYSQGTYQFVIDGKPTAINHEFGMIQLEDYFVADCHFDPYDWSKGTVINRLFEQGYHIRVRRPNGTMAPYWDYQVLGQTYQMGDLSDECSQLYRLVYTIENTMPGYDYSTGPGSITFFQYVMVQRFGVSPDNAESYFDPVICNPGTDIEQAWTGGPADNTESIIQYVRAHGGIVLNEGEAAESECWYGYMAFIDTTEMPMEDDLGIGSCFRKFEFKYTIENLGCTNAGAYSYYQNVYMPAPVFNTKDNKMVMDTIEVFGCGKDDAPSYCEYAGDFYEFGIAFENLLYEDSLKVKMFSEVEEGIVENQGLMLKRYYSVTDPCTGTTLYLVQYVKVKPYFFITRSRLRDESYHDEDELPEAYTKVEQLKAMGLRWDGSCPNPIVAQIGEDEIISQSPSGHSIFRRTYTVGSQEYDWLIDTVYQKIRYVPENGDPFIVTVDEANCDNGGKAKVYIEDSVLDEGCPSCLTQNQLWYRMVWENNSNSNSSVEVVYHDVTDDIWTADLVPGKYTLKVYATCSDYPTPADEPIWTYEFEVKAMKENHVFVKALNNAWSAANYLNTNHEYFYNTNTLVPWVHDVCTYDEPADAEWYDTRTDSNRTISYKWRGAGATKGYPKNEHDMIGMTEEEYEKSDDRKYFSWSPEFKERMGHLLFDGRMWSYSLKTGRNDLRVDVDYTNRDGSVGFEYGEFTVYYACLISAFDPNEIYGPEGYDTVHFINATDPITYTINFENDPEFATGSAARVKITCPLDDKGVANTFRLGNFGFGDYTFEVPSMASQYSQRLDLVDSLGVWLDVTAGIMVPDNYAYWIFQSIDPTTGLPPVGNLGFLPVNDTLNPGNGEGYVTFTINPRNNIVTGDEINEQANIVFDQNDTVPTNIYTNRFDAVAPSSVLVGDTTGVGETGILNFSFTASDDTDGSGVDYINLYVNIDNTDYELVGKVDPDTVYQYHMGLGSQFEFIGCAIDHVENKEEFKTAPEFTFIRGGAPTDIRLSASTFDEDAPLFTVIGNFTTTDDQTSNVFVYSLVDGEGADHNALFDIIGNALVTNNDFRCYGLYDYSIRVRSIDLSNQYMEKVFAVHAIQNMAPEITTLREFVCPNQPYYFGGEYLASGGIYYDTLQTALGCDSIVCLVLDNAAEPLLTELTDSICFGSSYADNGYDLTADTLALLTAGWSMDDVIVLSLDRYTENYYGCYDTTRLALTVLPAYHFEDEVVVCPTDLPFAYQGYSFYHDTTAVFHYGTVIGCDSTYTLRMTVNPDFGTQSNDLVEGWSWYSTFLDQNNGNGLASLENAMDGHGHTIKSMTAFARYSSSSNTWYGSLHELNNTSMFMIKMTDAHTTSVMGCPADIEPIMLAPGCTWIGYPLNDTIGVSQLTQAIEGNPSNNDVIKSKTAFAMYHEGNGVWHGLLKDLTPGNGYIYMSKSSAAKTLDYNNRSRIDDVHLLEMATTHWMADERKFADNMTMLGVITLDGQTIKSDTLEVGAFVNGEQRGAGRAVYIEEMDAYRIFLTIHGEEGDLISFRLFDHSRNRERRIRCKEQLTFRPDIHYGALDKPFSFVFLTDYDRYIQAEICEGEYYTENNFHVSRQGTYFQELTTAMGNDSIVRLDLTVNPVYHVEETVVATGFPFEYEGVVFDKPGTHILPFQTAAACDSVWVVTLKPYEGERELLISPVPVGRHEKVDLYFPFTEEEQQGIIVEVFTVGGNLLQTKRPIRFPIEIDPFATAGTYMVKITMGTGEVLTGKIVVK